MFAFFFHLTLLHNMVTNPTKQTNQHPFSTGTESSEIDRPRSKRGKVPRSSSLKIKSDVKQHLDANENDPMPLEIQTNFLSESVRKYLELGRAIPGKDTQRLLA